MAKLQPLEVVVWHSAEREELDTLWGAGSKGHPLILVVAELGFPDHSWGYGRALSPWGGPHSEGRI